MKCIQITTSSRYFFPGLFFFLKLVLSVTHMSHQSWNPDLLSRIWDRQQTANPTQPFQDHFQIRSTAHIWGDTRAANLQAHTSLKACEKWWEVKCILKCSAEWCLKPYSPVLIQVAELIPWASGVALLSCWQSTARAFCSQLPAPDVFLFSNKQWSSLPVWLL